MERQTENNQQAKIKEKDRRQKEKISDIEKRIRPHLPHPYFMHRSEKLQGSGRKGSVFSALCPLPCRTCL